MKLTFSHECLRSHVFEFFFSLPLSVCAELMMNAPALYREQVEEIDLVDKAIPAEKKFGSEVKKNIHVRVYCSVDRLSLIASFRVVSSPFLILAAHSTPKYPTTLWLSFFVSQFWRMSLRGQGSYFVCVGNIFSGLYLPIKADEKRPPPTFVRRPKARPTVAQMQATQRAKVHTFAWID